MASRYTPLTAWLRQRPGTGDVELSFTDLERLVGPLPASARAYRPWWANGAQAHAQAWLAAGWRVAMVHLTSERVRFSRDAVSTPAVQRHHPVSSPMRVLDSHGSGSQHLDETPAAGRAGQPTDEVDVRVRFSWQHAGAVRLDHAGKVSFPAVPAVAGLYRMSLTGLPELTRPRVYVGETDNLNRRLGHYRNPGPTQATNLRVNALLRDGLHRGGYVELAVCTMVHLLAGGHQTALDLTRVASRRLAENAALVADHHADLVDLENLL